MTGALLSPRNLLTATLTALCALLLALAVAAPSALALPSEFGTEGEGAGQLSESAGIAVNQESGDVFVADELNNRVDQFSGEGAFVRAWGWGVSDGSSKAFQVCNAPGPCFAGIGGTGGGQLAQPTGVAVDNSLGFITHGDVYVEDPFNNRVERFGPEGEFILTFGGGVNKTAVEKGETANEDVCPAASGDECQKGTTGPGPTQFERLERNAIAVGPTGTVYVGDVERVQKFSAAGAPQGEIPLPAAGGVELLAVDSSGELYVLSSALEGIRKYDGTGTEVPTPRDPSVHGLAPAITVGSGDQLLVSDPIKGHIFEYDAAGTQLGSFAEAQEAATGGIALNDSTKALYVIHREPARVVVQTLPPPGPVVLEGSEAASNILPTSATLNATINPEGPEETRYHFEYGTTTAYGTSVPEPEGELTPGFEDQPVSAPITGLQPRTLYHFRVLATNALNQTTLGPDQTFTTLPPVSIDSESVAQVTASSAKLLAELNPHGLPSEYHFEYGLTSSYEKSAPVPDAQAGERSEDASFAVTIEELQPHTLYHFRVVAHNSLGVAQGPDQTFTTQGGEASAPPDGRAYEMVSPPDKHGVSLEGLSAVGGIGGVIEAASGGGALTYFALGAIDQEPPGNRSNQNSQLLARRSGAGSWSTQDIATPHQAPAGTEVGNPSEYKLFSEDLTRGAVEPKGATPLSPAASERTPYLREADGTYRPLVSGCPPPGEPCKSSVEEAANVPAGTEFGGVEQDPEGFARGVQFVTGTPDLSHVLLRSPTSLVQGFENSGEESDYEWSEGASPGAPGTLQPVSLIPPAGAGSCGGTGPVCVPASEEETAQLGNDDFQVRGAISADGGRAFFATTAHGRLYARDIARGETLRVDAAEAGMKPADGGATFQLANGDGSKVLFTDGNKLTKDSTATAAKPDLYECEIVLEAEKLACKLFDLSVDPHLGESADVQGAVIGASEDGRYVYFVAKGALTAGAAQGSCPAPGEGQCVNVYVDDTVAQSKALVAVLSANDFPDWQAGEGGAHDLGDVTARVSPDGRYAAFMSQRSLTGFDNRDAHSGAHDEEVFLYHAQNPAAQAGTLACASCDPSGQRPVGVLDESIPGPLIDRPSVWSGHWLAGSIPGWTRVDLGHALRQPRYLSDSGRLFFNSAGSLVAADGNGTQDVYQHEPNGVGGCGEGSGCVALISSGTSSEESAFLDASESGGDVFFMTAAQLSGADQDKAFDVYDAHVCSVAPGCAPPAGGSPPPCATSDACRAAPAAQPDIFGAPASSTFSGAGNLAPPPPGKAKAKPLTRAQRLAKALKACRKKPKRKQAACRRQAHRRFGPLHKAKRARASKGGRK